MFCERLNRPCHPQCPALYPPLSDRAAWEALPGAARWKAAGEEALQNPAAMPELPLLENVIRYTVRVSEAKSAHKPLGVYDPFCSAAIDYRALAVEVMNIVSNVDTQEG